MIASHDQTLTFVLRTLPEPDPRAAKIPGVHPRATLLLEARGKRAERGVRTMFRYLQSRGFAARELSEEFWTRIDAVFNGRASQRIVGCLSTLLRHETGGP